MSTLSLKENFEKIVERSSEMMRELNTALDRYEASLRGADSISRMLELGALLACVRRGRDQALELLASVPSPNRVPSHLSEEVVGVANALFGFLESCDQREALIMRLAEGMRR